jgi:energy-coupling factor transporter ATP-binding protein EcfA2
MDSLIKSIENIEDDTPGGGFVKTLSGIVPPITHLRGGLSRLAELEIPDNFNEKQKNACSVAFNRPTLLCIQGTPGSGKTHLLSVIAQAYSKESKEVLVVALTHQAVNNALNKIKESDDSLPVFKIGDSFRAEGLLPSISVKETYNIYHAERKLRKNKRGVPADILGMTLHAATVNLGLRTTGYQPMIVLIDEAGQIPLTHAANIGSFGCGSVVLIGDHEQMPPIYANGLEDDKLSVSIFEHLIKLYPEKSITLNTTYRMNEEITSLCSRNFYEPHGVQLISSEFSKNRTMSIPLLGEENNKSSITYIIDSPDNNDSKEMNVEEAETAANIVNHLYEQGLNDKNVAVITPFRLQTRTIRELVASKLKQDAKLPLIDTVERLQGQDVDCIIVSFSVSDKKYLKAMESFIFQPNRLNVMISRAKKKVIFLMSQCVYEYWKETII